MAERIIVINLNNKTSEVLPYDVTEGQRYGRGLVLDLMKKYVPDGTDRWDSDNAIVLVPGLFAGNKAPSAGRMFVATIADREHGIQYSNTTGNIPQRMGSMGIAAVLITGIADEQTVLHISDSGVEFNNQFKLEDKPAGEIVKTLKDKYGRDIAAIGSGIAGDKRMSLSTFWCTYCDGIPEYHTPRNGFGDVWGSKNLRAVVFDGGSMFDRECENPEKFMELTRKLTKVITENEICGGALPSLGSVTLMRALKNKEVLGNFKATNRSEVAKECPGTNRSCAPMCVIGCLNRHDTNDAEHYSTPAQIEMQVCIEQAFGVDDYELARKVLDRTTELCIASTEFVTAAKVFAVANNIEDGAYHLLEWLDEIEKGTITGRVIASRTTGMNKLYGDAKLIGLIDRKTTAEEKDFNIKMESRYPSLGKITPLELLYTQIFVLENLGFCIFTSFAILDEAEPFDILSEMMSARTGMEVSSEQLLLDARTVMQDELAFERNRWESVQSADIPTFTKVLYRYFDSK